MKRLLIQTEMKTYVFIPLNHRFNHIQEISKRVFSNNRDMTFLLDSCSKTDSSDSDKVTM